MGALAQISEAARGIEDEYEHKAILYIGSESYDAPTITLLRGLHSLGFTICTIEKPNINSWNIGTVVPCTSIPQFDFVLSNLHWGTRWSHYDRFGLHGAPNVLVDGDDNHWGITWREKYQKYQQRYAGATQEQKDRHFATRRWIEPLGSYEPDIVFAGQNQPGHPTHYLPFGIMPEYTEMTARCERTLYFLHVMGAGPYRQDAHKMLTGHEWKSLEFIGAPARHSVRGVSVESRVIRGGQTWPEWVPQQGRTEKNIHSWHRWSVDTAYYRALAGASVLIHPGISRHQWESKRQWEAWACGCVVLMRKPPLDTSDYPLDELVPGPLLTFTNDLLWHCEMLASISSKRMEDMRQHIMNVACTYFTPVPIARYALHKIIRMKGA